jgi:P4 family phage/plasmid primase-like protien
MSAASSFNTIQYCIDNNIPCFTFTMDHTKKCNIAWKQINSNNFTSKIDEYDNGFAIITGGKFIVIDFDLKHSPPENIFNILTDHCECIEQTPGGYHFWFHVDSQTSNFTSNTNISWDNTSIEGLDIRATGGICYTTPSYYMVQEEKKKYKWLKGNLSTATILSSIIINHLTTTTPDISSVKYNIVESPKTDDEILTILNGLSQKRNDNYASWLAVGMALKNSGYSCELWDEWSKQSPKYRYGTCHQKWNTFTEKENPITKASLYAWLKEDNYDLFITIQGNNDENINALLAATNASIAETFYRMNPTRYLYSTVDGWYILQPNHIWVCTNSTDIMSIPNILNTIRNECNEVLGRVILKLNRTNEEDGIKHKMLGEALKRLSSSSFLKAVTAFLPGLYHKHGVEELFNEKRHLLGFTNGVMDMNTFTFRTIEPDDYITITCGYDYRPIEQSEKSLVRTFLEKIFPNESVLQYILFALSKTLVGENIEQIFHVFTGMGANGKSCLMDLCKIVFGKYYHTFNVTYLTKEDDGKDKPLPELAAARYCRMLVTSEAEERDKFQIALLKRITGNEEVSFRGMYAKHACKYIPQFKLWILTNEIPKLSKYDQAIERRMRCVHFPTRFVYHPRSDNEQLRDDTLGQQFKTNEQWRFGLLGLLLDIAKGKQGVLLEMPQEVSEFTDNYMLENNPVGAWLRQFYTITGRREDSIQKTELYKIFLADSGIHKTQKSFSDDITKCNIGEKKVMGERFYFGLIRK